MCVELTTRTWPTSMSLMPSIVRFSMVFSGVFSGQSSGDPHGTIGLTIDPVVMVHNPYDVAIEFEGIAMVTNGDSLPYIVDVQLRDWVFNSTELQYFDPERPSNPHTGQEPLLPAATGPWLGYQVSRTLTIGEVALGDSRTSRSTIGGTFTAQVIAETTIGPHAAIIPRITGSAWVYGRETLRVSRDDPFPAGFALSDTWGPQVGDL